MKLNNLSLNQGKMIGLSRPKRALSIVSSTPKENDRISAAPSAILSPQAANLNVNHSSVKAASAKEFDVVSQLVQQHHQNRRKYE
jgi:hypothetical protein